MKFKEKKIRVDGNIVSYFDEGKPGGIPLILIHGFPFSKLMWENQIDVFKGHCRVLAYDIRGHGNADAGTDEFSIVRFAEDLLLFMDALQIEKAFICGLSMGGYIALNAIALQPARIVALVLCDSQCLADNEQAKKKRMDTIASIQENGLSEYARDSVKKMFSKSSLENKKEEVSFIENTILHTPQETICNTLKALARRNETCSTLHLINIPVLIMVGEEDQVTPPAVSQKMHAEIPDSIMHLIGNAGHLSNLENPERFNAHLQRFLKLGIIIFSIAFSHDSGP